MSKPRVRGTFRLEHSCLEKGREGKTPIVPGVKHTRLKRWRQTLESEVFFEPFPFG